MGHLCLQMTGTAAVPVHKVRGDAVAPREPRASEDVIN